jgi:hypothetical protein
MAFFHLSDTPKSRSFSRSLVAASCGGRLFPQSALSVEKAIHASLPKKQIAVS